ncbi:MAG: homoaconitase [Phycisphaerales bacterium]|nr:homoaconitase [Phycisphaerales bacterium]
MFKTALTLVEKLASRWTDSRSGGAPVRCGDFVTIRPKHVMTHDNTGAVIPKFKQIGATRIADPSQPVFAIDHDIQNITPENLGKYAKIASFAREHGIDHYPAGTGISHQVMVEQGYVTPGSMVVGSDSHSNLYGALCALGTPVVRTDAACLWATGTTWWQVPPVARVTLRGALQSGVTGKDVIVTLCGFFNRDEVLNHAVEFGGEGVAGLSVSARMSISNMTTEWGALAGVFPFDEVLREYLLERADYFTEGRRPGTRAAHSKGSYSRGDVTAWWNDRHTLAADPHAAYAAELELDLSTVIPHVSGPNDVKVMSSLPEIESRRVTIAKAWLMSCVNARLEDIAEAAAVVAGKRVAAGVEFFIAPASAEVQAQAERLGYWSALLECGAKPLPPGCGTCIGLGAGLIQAGEVGISSTNRNFKGRMGDPGGQVYLGSPAVVAASAIAGFICAPTKFVATSPRASVKQTSRLNGAPETLVDASESVGRGNPTEATVQVIAGFPPIMRGRVLFMNKDNMNTDGIFAGKHTYNDKMTPSEQALVVFENYDPAFADNAHSGDIVVSGLNFGTGSSREQAATALKHFGIPCVIAATFSETYKRNAFNNGFVVFECPGLVTYLRARFAGSTEPTVLAPEIEIDYARSTVRLGSESFTFSPLSPVAQELVVAGGAAELVMRGLAK